jgi:dTDP-4-amino-4,6-dideoxygalactose transaminase
MIKLFDPPRHETCLRALRDVFQSGLWANGAGGPYVRKFEGEFTRYVGSRDTVAVNSGTSALYLALRAINCTGRKVLLPSLTFVSAAHAIRLAGAEPIFVDVDESSLNISIVDLRKKLTEDVAAVIVVHFAGRPCDMGAVTSLARDKELFVIEDCAHSCGATYHGTRTGALSHLGCFSFHPVKNMATFGGGAITLNDHETKRDKLDDARWCGIDTKNRVGPIYDVKDIGWNYYMCEASAAIALAQLPRLDEENKKRREIAKFYDKELEDLSWLVTPPYSDECVYHLYPIRVMEERDRFIRHMASRGIECGIHYARGIHQFSFYSDLKASLPVTEKIVKELVSIPIYPSLTEAQLEAIISSIRKYK